MNDEVKLLKKKKKKGGGAGKNFICENRKETEIPREKYFQEKEEEIKIRVDYLDADV